MVGSSSPREGTGARRVLLGNMPARHLSFLDKGVVGLERRPRLSTSLLSDLAVGFLSTSRRVG